MRKQIVFAGILAFAVTCGILFALHLESGKPTPPESIKLAECCRD